MLLWVQGSDADLWLQPSFPNITWEPLKELEVVDRGLSADPEKKSLLSAATKVKHLTPAIGTEIEGIDLRQLSDSQKDELYALLLILRPVYGFLLTTIPGLSSSLNVLLSVSLRFNHRFNFNDLIFYHFLVFRDQEINIHEQLELARHFGPLHKHATTPIPRNGLDEVHGMPFVSVILSPAKIPIYSRL